MTEPSARRDLVPPDAKYRAEREEDGQYNDLSKPTMGNAAFDGPDFTKSNQGARFGRNIPLSEVDPSRDGGILDPNPRLVSNLLLARQSTPGNPSGFQPVGILNLLAAAWIQFQVHDWFNHGTPRTITDEAFEVPIPPGDEWPDGPTMRVRRTRADPTRRKNDNAGPETFANAETHWWGRLPDLRRQPADLDAVPRAQGWEAQDRSEDGAHSGRRGRDRENGSHRELVGRPEPAA